MERTTRFTGQSASGNARQHVGHHYENNTYNTYNTNNTGDSAAAKQERLNKNLLEAAEKGCTHRLRAMLNAGADFDCTDLDGWTALHLAAHYGNNESVRILIDAGSDINAFTDRQEYYWCKTSPLHLAVDQGHTQVVRTLASTPGIDRNVVDDFGWTALHCAAVAVNTEVLKILLQGGWGVNAETKQRETPLHLAVEKGRIDTVRALVEGGAKPIRKTETVLHRWKWLVMSTQLRSTTNRRS